ncbi:CpaE family protein [Leifsonia sp. YAF41]|uniref:AAA family ATPase n=1 Tax=Leifsonia sp. YAF41 TaxID=3233086 RepID=UPI003F9D3229
MATFALALDNALEDRLLLDLIEHGHTVVARSSTADELVVVLGRTVPDVVLVLAERPTLTAALLAACDERGVRLIALIGSDPGRRHAAALGLYEVLDAEAGWPAIEAMINAEVPAPDRGVETPAGAFPSPCTVLAVWGPAGAPGRTTLAINIAAEIAATGHTVALVDADTYSGSVAATLGMLDEAPGFAAACRLAGADALTQSELERIAQRYTSSHGAFWVLTGIGRASRWPELSTERITRTLSALRQWVEYVVIDTGFSLESDEELSSDLFAPRRNAATLTALGAADHVVACGLGDPVGMARFLRSWVDLADVLTTRRLTVVMNRVRSSAVGLDPKGQILHTLRRFGGIDGIVLIPDDQRAVDGAVLSGRPLQDSAPKSPVRASIRRLVTTEILAAPTPVRPKRWPLRAAKTQRAFS